MFSYWNLSGAPVRTRTYTGWGGWVSWWPPAMLAESPNMAHFPFEPTPPSNPHRAQLVLNSCSTHAQLLTYFCSTLAKVEQNHIMLNSGPIFAQLVLNSCSTLDVFLLNFWAMPPVPRSVDFDIRRSVQVGRCRSVNVLGSFGQCMCRCSVNRLSS